ncbi:unnamed protein product, partial [Iphiclides podalirius]
MSLSKWLWRTTRSCLNRQNIREEHLLQRATNLNGSLSKIIDDGLAISDLAKTTTLRERIRKMIEYHTIERVPVQGQITLLAYEMLEQPEKIKDHTLHQAVVLAWAVELIQSYFLIMDDLEDGAATRCGKPCWHLLPEVKTLVMNDASMFRSFIHEIIQQNFKEPLYTNLTTLFNENDFMDCFDAESTTGKTGTDIQEGKCTWLAVNSLQRCSARQRKIFHECYGSWDPEHVARIKQIYEDMALTKLYKEDQRIRYENFMSQVRELPSNAVPSPALFLQLLNVIQSNQ